MGAAVEAEADAGGAGVVRVLDELAQRGGALRVVGQHLADAAREVHPLAKVLEQHRAPAAHRIHGDRDGASGALGLGFGDGIDGDLGLPIWACFGCAVVR